MRGFIAPASNADVYTSANLSGRGPSICCRRPFCRLKAPLGLSLLRCAPQTRILLCKILVGNTQTRELHPVDAGCAIASLIRSNSSQPYIIAHTPDQDVKCRSGHLHLRKQPLHDSFVLVIAAPYSSAPDSCPHGRMSQVHLTILQRASWRSRSWISRSGAGSGSPSCLWFLLQNRCASPCLMEHDCPVRGVVSNRGRNIEAFGSLHRLKTSSAPSRFSANFRSTLFSAVPSVKT